MADEQPIIPTDYWADYARDTQQYLNRPAFEGTPLTGDMMAQAAHNAYQKTMNTVPLELALSQGQFETGMGKQGRNPQTNPFNVGEFDSGTKMTFPNTTAGVQAYYDLMAKDYLRKKQMAELLQSFTNYRNQRYATDPNYEKKIGTQMDFITKFLNENK